MTLQESGSAVPRTTSSALTPSSSPPGGRQGRMSSATRGGPVLAAASGSPAGGHKPEPVGAGMSSAEASDHARSRGYERGALSRGGPRSRGHAGGSLTFGISHSAWRTHGPPPAGGNRDRRHAATPRWLPDPCAGPHTSRPAAVPGLTRRTPPRHARFCARHRGRDRFSLRMEGARCNSQTSFTGHRHRPPSRRGPSRPARLHRPQNRGPRRAWPRGEVSRNLGGRGAPTAAGELAGISSGPGSSGTVTARF